MYNLRNAHRSYYDMDSDIARDILAEIDRVKFKDLHGKAIDGVLDKYYIYKEVEHKSGKSMLWRVTIPLFLVWHLFTILVIFPLNWAITGTYQFNHKSKHYKFTNKWHELIFEKTIIR